MWRTVADKLCSLSLLSSQQWRSDAQLCQSSIVDIAVALFIGAAALCFVVVVTVVMIAFWREYRDGS